MSGSLLPTVSSLSMLTGHVYVMEGCGWCMCVVGVCMCVYDECGCLEEDASGA